MYQEGSTAARYTCIPQALSSMLGGFRLTHNPPQAQHARMHIRRGYAYVLVPTRISAGHKTHILEEAASLDCCKRRPHPC